jgi:hypothetical protein
MAAPSIAVSLRIRRPFFAMDLAAGKWVLIVDFSTIAL